MSTDKDFSWLPRVTDAPGVSFTWTQACDNKDPALGITFYLHDVPTTVTSKDLSVKIKDNNIINVSHLDKTIVQWKLMGALDVASEPIEWVISRDTTPISIDVTAKKVTADVWLCLRSQPVLKNEGRDEFFVTEEELQAFVELEVPVLPMVDEDEVMGRKSNSSSSGGAGDGDAASQQQQSSDNKTASDGDSTKVHQSDAVAASDSESPKKDGEVTQSTNSDAIFDEVFDEIDMKKEDSAGAAAKSGEQQSSDKPATDSALTADVTSGMGPKQVTPDLVLKVRRDREAQMYDVEFEALRKAHAEAEAKVAENHTEEDAKEIQRILDQVRKTQELVLEKRTLRAQHVSMANLISIVQLELKKFLMHAGSATGTETEAVRAEEKDMTGQAIFQKAMDQLHSSEPNALDETFHFLRVAALHHNHSAAAVMLNKLYAKYKAPLKGAFFVLRHALLNPPEPHANRIIGEHVANGVHPFTSLFSVAVHFFQRAAVDGDAQSLVALAHLFFQGRCRNPKAYMHPVVRQKFQDEKRAKRFMQAALDRGCSDAYFGKACFHLDGERGHAKDRPLARKWFALLKGTNSDVAARTQQMFNEAPDPSSPPLPGGNTSSTNQLSLGGSSAGGSSSIGSTGGPLVSGGGAGGGMADRLNKLNQGNVGSMMQSPPSSPVGNASVTSGASQSMSVRPERILTAGQKTMARWEMAARVAGAGYAVYMVAFPVRLMLLPFFYEYLGGFIARLTGGGGGGGPAGGREFRGGMF